MPWPASPHPLKGFKTIANPTRTYCLKKRSDPSCRKLSCEQLLTLHKVCSGFRNFPELEVSHPKHWALSPVQQLVNYLTDWSNRTQRFSHPLNTKGQVSINTTNNFTPDA